MTDNIQRLPSAQILNRLAELFQRPAHDRHVYCVYGPYAKLKPFQKKLRQQVEAGNLNSLGRVEYLSLNRDVLSHMRAMGTYDEAARLADNDRNQEFCRLLSAGFRDLITRRIEPNDVTGLVLADFELLYAYGLGTNDITLARQVAINGKRVCLLVPSAMRDGRLWIFDEDPESVTEFPEALVFKNSGWVFELA